jgi:hypothetical protein
MLVSLPLTSAPNPIPTALFAPKPVPATLTEPPELLELGVKVIAPAAFAIGINIVVANRNIESVIKAIITAEYALFLCCIFLFSLISSKKAYNTNLYLTFSKKKKLRKT